MNALSARRASTGRLTGVVPIAAGFCNPDQPGLEKRPDPPADGNGPVSAFGDLAAERTIFLFETGNVARDQKRGLINPVIASNPTSEIAELAIQFRHVGSRHLCDLCKAGHAERFKQRIQLGANAL